MTPITKGSCTKRKCPDCGGVSNLVSVNTSPSNQVGGDYNALEYCIDYELCGYEKYFNIGAKIIKKIHKKSERPNFKNGKFKIEDIRIIKGTLGCCGPGGEPPTWIIED